MASTFPLHDPTANAKLLRKWSHTLLLNAEDLDAIRALYGEKVFPDYIRLVYDANVP